MNIEEIQNMNNSLCTKRKSKRETWEENMLSFYQTWQSKGEKKPQEAPTVQGKIVSFFFLACLF